MEGIAVIALVFFVFLVFGGVIVNVFVFYLRDAFRAGKLGHSPRLGSVTLSREVAEHNLYMSLGVSSDHMEDHIRRVIYNILAGIVLLSLVIALFISIARP